MIMESHQIAQWFVNQLGVSQQILTYYEMGKGGVGCDARPNYQPQKAAPAMQRKARLPRSRVAAQPKT